MPDTGIFNKWYPAKWRSIEPIQTFRLRSYICPNRSYGPKKVRVTNLTHLVAIKYINHIKGRGVFSCREYVYSASMPYCSICGTWYQEGMHSIEVCASRNMAENNAPGKNRYESDESLAKTGAETGEAFAEMGMLITKRFPRLSIVIGLIATAIFIYYGIEEWDFHPIIFAIMSLFVFWFSTYFLITSALAIAAIGIVGFVIVYLLSLL